MEFNKSKMIIIDYGAGNTQSVLNAFNRLGINPIVSSDLNILSKADRLVLPGVGDARFAMNDLKKNELDQFIINFKKPFLGICLGMQLLSTFSEEGNVSCLNIIKTPTLKFNHGEKVPHIGWNAIHNLKGALFKNVDEKSYVYFVHSYFLPLNQETSSICDYHLSFSSSIEKDNFFAVQFHPEKSGNVGEEILKNFSQL